MHIAIGDYARLLRHYLAPQGRVVVAMAALLLGSIALQLAGPQVVRAYIDAARAGASENALIAAALAFIGLTAGQQALNVGAIYASECVAWTATNSLRTDLVAHLVSLDLEFHKAHTPGELLERVDGDVNVLAGFFSSFVVKLSGSALLLAGVLGAVFLLDARLGLAFAAFAAAALALLDRIRRIAAPHWRAEREQSAAFYGFAGEVLGATEDLRANGAVPYALRRFHEHVHAWLPVRWRAQVWGEAVWMAAVGVFSAGTALAYGLGGALHGTGALSLGAVYLLAAYMAMLAEPIETIRTQLQDLQRADAGIARVRELLELRSRLDDGTEELPPGPLAVEFRDVGFEYAEAQSADDRAAEERAPALHGVTFALAPGRMLGLLGRTGSGKTTLARLLFRWHDVRQGAVCVGGIDVRCIRLTSLRARVGLVTQDVQLLDASLRDNITFYDPGVSDERVLAALADLGLQDWLGRLPGAGCAAADAAGGGRSVLDMPVSAAGLSAGEAQLVALARLFLKDPGLVILDEASSRLDPVAEALLERALARLLAGRTVIIISHRPAAVERVDDVLILEGGRVAEYAARVRLAAEPESRFVQLMRCGAWEGPA